MSELKISLAQVSECANTIRSCNNLMYESLNRMKKEMNGTNVNWLSDGGDTIRNRFNAFASRFDIQKEAIDSYARFLDQTVESYDTLETTITSNASGMQV